MNIKDYISSGAIENYVLGLTSSQETAEMKALAQDYPEIQEAIDAYRKSLEEYSNLYAVKPPAALKTRIMDALHQEINKAPSQPVDEQAKPVAMHTSFVWRWVAAAAIILLIVSLVFNGIYIHKQQQDAHKYAALKQKQQQLIQQTQNQETQLASIEKNMQAIADPDIQPVVMKGVPAHPGIIATVYWDAANRHAYLTAADLPAPPAGKAYQLWAIVDGKPVDMGMYNPTKDKGPIAMKNVVPGQVQAFAITLEKAGGSATPTMSQMYVIGKI